MDPGIGGVKLWLMLSDNNIRKRAKKCQPKSGKDIFLPDRVVVCYTGQIDNLLHYRMLRLQLSIVNCKFHLQALFQDSAAALKKLHLYNYYLNII